MHRLELKPMTLIFLSWRYYEIILFEFLSTEVASIQTIKKQWNTALKLKAYTLWGSYYLKFGAVYMYYPLALYDENKLLILAALRICVLCIVTIFIAVW